MLVGNVGVEGRTGLKNTRHEYYPSSVDALHSQIASYDVRAFRYCVELVAHVVPLFDKGIRFAEQWRSRGHAVTHPKVLSYA